MPKIKKFTAAASVATAMSNLPHRAGLPAQDSVIAITEAPRLKILHTEEVDRYEKGASGLGLATEAVKAAPPGDNFARERSQGRQAFHFH
jgi:hypothetical protein